MNEETPKAAVPQSNSVLKQIIGFVIAAVLIWLSFRNVDAAELWEYVKGLDPVWLAAIALSCVISHVVRAQRWLILLQPLTDRKLSLFNSFCAIMLGYAVNIAIPRAGEVARMVSISRSEKLSLAGVLPTMFIDRLLDIAALVALIGVTLVLLPADMKATMPWLVPSGITMCVATVVGLFVLPQTDRLIVWLLKLPIANSLPERIRVTLLKLSQDFNKGTLSLKNPVRFPMIAFLSIVIWAFYWLNLYLLLWSFHLQERVSLVQSIMVFTMGTVGVLIPTPGSVGGVHMMMSNALKLVSGLPQAQALAFATVLHAWTFVIVVCVATLIVCAVQSAMAAKSATSTNP